MTGGQSSGTTESQGCYLDGSPECVHYNAEGKLKEYPPESAFRVYDIGQLHKRGYCFNRRIHFTESKRAYRGTHSKRSPPDSCGIFSAMQ